MEQKEIAFLIEKSAALAAKKRVNARSFRIEFGWIDGTVGPLGLSSRACRPRIMAALANVPLTGYDDDDLLTSLAKKEKSK